MNTADIELDMPDHIFEEWEDYTTKQKRFLFHMLNGNMKQTEAYVAAGFASAGAKTNSYKVLKKLENVWDWMQVWKAKQAANEGVISLNEMLKVYSERFRQEEVSNSDLIKLGKEIAALCMYYPDAKADLINKQLDAKQKMIELNDLPDDVKLAIASAIKEKRKLEDKS